MQTELFDLPSPRTLSEESTVTKTSFLEKTFITLRLDQAIGLTLALLVVYVLTFSWGVEKGKKSVRESQSPRAVSAVELSTEPSPAVVASVAKAPVVAMIDESIPKEVPLTVAELPKPVAKVSKPDGKYTIQHVTYITQSAADREIQKLAQKGYSSFVIPSGKHLQVCIAAFQSRQDASQLLKQLRGQGLVSGDAYVRPMVR
ncbi:MAG: SPOR domain-containing protein [Candidatus Omnitrophica bacterium]|nr:SPOR domain-containing protein [Candidatus Omnitrophota bacterium]